jgi:hypothetical protein
MENIGVSFTQNVEVLLFAIIAPNENVSMQQQIPGKTKFSKCCKLSRLYMSKDSKQCEIFTFNSAI